MILLHLIFIFWLNFQYVKLDDQTTNKTNSKINNNECLFINCECQTLFENSFSVFCQQTNSNEFPVRNTSLSTLPSTYVSLIFIKSYNLGKLPEDSFSYLDINNLKLENNRIQVIDKYSFRNIKRLISFSFNDPSLQLIESDALAPLITHLEHLDLSGCDAGTDKMDFFFNEGGLSQLKMLKSLRLDSNRLTTLSATWLANFEQLTEVSFAYNELKTINQFVFKYTPSIVSVSFAHNSLNKFYETFLALRPLADMIETLNLRENVFEVFLNFPNLKRLKLLDLSKNTLKQIDENTFESLDALESLYLSSNKLAQIHVDAFRILKNLKNLYLDNNFLVSTPVITNLRELTYLTLENQNNQLNSPLRNFAFRIDNQTSSFFELNLARNYLTQGVEDKIFCSVKLSRLTVGFNTLNKIDKCILRQLLTGTSTTTSLSLFVTDIYDYTLFCMNCDTRLFYTNYNINLNGACGNYSVESVCSNKTFVDKCSSQAKYSCLSNENESTETLTTEKPSTSNTTVSILNSTITTYTNTTTMTDSQTTTKNATTTTTKKCLCNEAKSYTNGNSIGKLFFLLSLIYFLIK